MDTRRQSFRALFQVAGLVATGAGLHTAFAGARSVAGHTRHQDAALESELRFYGGIYAALGVDVLRFARRADSSPDDVRRVAGAVFLAGLARASGWLRVGRPEPLQIGLLAIELVAPPAVVAWQARLAEGD